VRVSTQETDLIFRLADDSKLNLDAQDRIDLILSPLMRQRRALDVVLPEAATMAQSPPSSAWRIIMLTSAW